MGQLIIQGEITSEIAAKEKPPLARKNNAQGHRDGFAKFPRVACTQITLISVDTGMSEKFSKEQVWSACDNNTRWNSFGRCSTIWTKRNAVS